jgi:hypothetical protein
MKKLTTVAATLLLAGCYHATIETGRPPSPQQIDIPWAKAFVYGLVPPATVQAQEQCPSGVARVETKISFMNGLVSAITFAIFTPMHITVTCASGEEQEEAGLQRVSSEEELREALESGDPFLLPLK